MMRISSLRLIYAADFIEFRQRSIREPTHRSARHYDCFSGV